MGFFLTFWHMGCFCVCVHTSDTQTADVDSSFTPDQHTTLTLGQTTLPQKLL